jgi:hypothetical protein
MDSATSGIPGWCGKGVISVWLGREQLCAQAAGFRSDRDGGQLRLYWLVLNEPPPGRR